MLSWKVWRLKKNTQFRTAVSDITDQVLSGEALRYSEEKYRLLFEEMMSGFALLEIIFDGRGKPMDARILDVNPAYERITGLKKEQIIGKTVLEVLPETESYWFENFAKVVLTGLPIQFENYHKGLDKHFFVAAFKHKNNQVAIHFTEITERKKAEIELQKAHEVLEKRILERTANLAASNASLKQSHWRKSVKGFFQFWMKCRPLSILKLRTIRFVLPTAISESASVIMKKKNVMNCSRE
jgi:PAS domain S-box-containing protein